MTKRLVVLLALFGLTTTAGIAAAAEQNPEDTTFNYGYDEGNQVLLWNSNPSDGLYDCALDVHGNLRASYGLTGEGIVVVAGLHDGTDAVVTFNPTPPDEVSEGLEAATEPVDYTGADGECVVGGGVVAGPNGQVNHGMFMKLFNAQFEGKARGCVARYLAKSDLGKGDQKVRVSDIEDDAPELADGDEGNVEFTTVLADCERGRADQTTGAEKAAAKKAAKADKSDKTKGKSADAPGRNKNP